MGCMPLSRDVNGIRTYRHAKSVETRQHSLDYMNRRFPKYLPFLNENISDLCCEKLKKGPLKRYANQNNLYCSIIGTLAVESKTRMDDWIRHGSNIFGIKKITSVGRFHFGQILTSINISRYISFKFQNYMISDTKEMVVCFVVLAFPQRKGSVE